MIDIPGVEEIKKGSKKPWIIGGIALFFVFAVWKFLRGGSVTGQPNVTAIPVPTSNSLGGSGGGMGASDPNFQASLEVSQDQTISYIDKVADGLQTQIETNQNSLIDLIGQIISDTPTTSFQQPVVEPTTMKTPEVVATTVKQEAIAQTSPTIVANIQKSGQIGPGLNEGYIGGVPKTSVVPAATTKGQSFVEAATILNQGGSFQNGIAVLNTQPKTATAPTPPVAVQQPSVLDQMKANSSAWGSASATEQKKLAETNLKLGSSMGAYRDNTGTWYAPNGTKLY